VEVEEEEEAEAAEKLVETGGAAPVAAAMFVYNYFWPGSWL
jgi:hypothetical protein